MDLAPDVVHPLLCAYHKAMAMILRIRWRLLGGHYHCRLFGCKTMHGPFALYGKLIIPEDEWEIFKKMLPNISVVPESDLK